MKPPTPQQAQAALQITRTIADAIRELGSVPNGHLWARLDGTITFDTYTSILDVLKRAKVIEERNHLLVWTGPKKEQQP